MLVDIVHKICWKLLCYSPCSTRGNECILSGLCSQIMSRERCAILRVGAGHYRFFVSQILPMFTTTPSAFVGRPKTAAKLPIRQTKDQRGWKNGKWDQMTLPNSLFYLINWFVEQFLKYLCSVSWRYRVCRLFIIILTWLQKNFYRKQIGWQENHYVLIISWNIAGCLFWARLPGIAHAPSQGLGRVVRESRLTFFTTQ